MEIKFSELQTDESSILSILSGYTFVFAVSHQNYWFTAILCFSTNYCIEVVFGKIS